MNSQNVTIRDLPGQLLQIGLRTTAGNLDDLLARAIRLKWSPQQLLEMIIKNLAHVALQAGQTVMFRTAAEVISDLTCESPRQRRQKLRRYAGIDLLCIDEIGYLAYDASATDLLYEVVNSRYESGSIVMTTNRHFAQWNEVFPNATSIGMMLDRLSHHADITVIKGPSYRLRESEAETAARRKTR